MISAVFKRSIIIDGHKTSVTLEDEFWGGLREIARRRNATITSLVMQIDDARTENNLSSAIRIFVLNYFRMRADQKVSQNERIRSGVVCGRSAIVALTG
jgi:predicted DNA-binding ribbon-helix-helix protein